MRESELLGKLLPGHPDIFPIIQSIREKFQIPPVDPENSDITELLITNHEIDWKAVKQEIEEQVKDIPWFEDAETKYIQLLKNIQQNKDYDFPEFDILPESTRKPLKALFAMLTQQSEIMLQMLDNQTYKPLTEIIYEYLLTGKTSDAPKEWFGKVVTMNVLGKPIVMALAAEGSNIKDLAEQFKGEYTRTFGNDRPEVTNAYLDTAEYLAMKLQGNSLRRLVERYEERYPDQFPKNKDSKAYKDAITTHKEMMKKRIQRLKNFIEEFAGDEN